MVWNIYPVGIVANNLSEKKTLKLKVLAYHAVLLRSQKQTNETTKQEDVTKKKRKENKKTLNKAGLFRIEKS